MKVDKIYVGGWFQRTMLQLSEVYDFLRNGTSQLRLDPKKLQSLRKNLNIGKIDYFVRGLEYLEFTTSLNITVKIFEDGLITLENSETKEDTLFTDIEKLTDYYEQNLSKALNYLFSLGAPVPKELASIENIYPYFIVLNKANKAEISDLMARTERQKYFEFNNKKFDVIRGDKYYFINNKTEDIDSIERYIEEQIFIREFKGQLHRYLNLHRIIWERIADVKENAYVKGKNIVEFSSKIEDYYKTITLIEGRINQMSTYISTREKIAKSDTDLAEFLALQGYRYETLKDTLVYIQHLWSMTKNYVNSAKALFADLESKVTEKSIGNLTIVTSMGVGASIIGLFTESEPTFTLFGFIYFFILALVGYSVTKLMKYISKNRKYHIQDIEYEKNIK